MKKYNSTNAINKIVPPTTKPTTNPDETESSAAEMVVAELEEWTIDTAGLRVDCCRSPNDDVELVGGSSVSIETLVAAAADGKVTSPVN